MSRQVRILVGISLTLGLLFVSSRYTIRSGGPRLDAVSGSTGVDWGWLAIASLPTLASILLG